jgi:adenosylcobinamide-phosphate synthase
LYLELALIAYIIDRVFGEFSFIKFYKHPVVFMGDYIKLFEKNFYKDSIFIGGLLTISLIIIVASVVFCIEYFIDNTLLLALIASSGLASKMLYDSVKNIAINPLGIKYLVSRDTTELSSSDINKAAIETYAENLSDGVIAPLFYLLIFGLYGLFIYKAINTLDSMVGYRTKKYENFGKFSAILDDVLNYIPARLAAILISILFVSKKALLNFSKSGKKHESLNAGYPISAMAFALDLKLGGDTSYFGKVKSKPYFGDGKSIIAISDIYDALKFQIRLDILLLLLFLVIL